jgi:hypothetical protein
MDDMLGDIFCELRGITTKSDLFRASPGGVRRALGFEVRNRLGLAGFVWSAIVFLVWMLPKSFDDVLADPVIETTKFLDLSVAGVLLLDSVQRAPLPLETLFLGNSA